MKSTIISTTLILFATTLLLSRTNAEDAVKVVSTRTCAVQVGQTTVAILPCIKESKTEGTASSIQHDKRTGVTTLTGDAKIVYTVPGKSTITISGNDLALVPQK